MWAFPKNGKTIFHLYFLHTYISHNITIVTNQKYQLFHPTCLITKFGLFFRIIISCYKWSLKILAFQPAEYHLRNFINFISFFFLGTISSIFIETGNTSFSLEKIVCFPTISTTNTTNILGSPDLQNVPENTPQIKMYNSLNRICIKLGN